jgi:LuxR family transcriptional regulator, maltose regulon positive regulatory protein
MFRRLGLGLSGAQLNRLVERTEGWAAGLRLAALHLLDCDDVDSAIDTFSGAAHSVAGYLRIEVLDRQAPALLDFLESVSAVDQVTAGLADALTGGDDGEAKLTELAASLLFVEAVGRSGRWYRLHRLVADILRARANPPRRRRDLHRRAAEWFRDHDMPLDAVQLALRGQLWPLAADLVGRYLVAITLRGEAHRLEQLLTDAPRTEVLSRPELAAGLAGARVVQGRAKEVAGLLDAARAGLSQLSEARAERLGVALDLVGGALARLAGDFDTLVAVYGRVPQEPTALARLGMAAAEIVPVVVLNNLGTAELWAGDLSRAAEYLNATMDHGTDGPTLPHLNATAHLALLRCERGELVAAEAAARDVAVTAAGLGWDKTPQAVGAYLAMARILLDRDELADLDHWLQQVAEVESVGPESHIRLAAALVVAARRSAAGDAEAALTGLRVTCQELEPWTPPRGLAEQWMLAEATLLVRLADPVGARRLLSVLGPPRTDAGVVALARVHLLLGDVPVLPAMPDAGPRISVGVHLVEALQASLAGAHERGLDRLEEALLAAAPSRLRRPFLVEAAELRTLLDQRIDHGSAVTAFALDLQQRISGTTVDELAARRALIDPLTEREQTILRYLASSLSNAEIANELYLSVNTIKTHQRTIYRKLGAEGRRDAVRRARTLHLL